MENSGSVEISVLGLWSLPLKDKHNYYWFSLWMNVYFSWEEHYKMSACGINGRV